MAEIVNTQEDVVPYEVNSLDYYNFQITKE